MTMGKPNPLPWSGSNDRAVVEEMLKDPKSEYWDECYTFVEGLVHKRAKNIPPDSLEDIIQEAMIKFKKSLPTFQRRCSLKTWLFRIVGNCIIDDHRKITRIMPYLALPTSAYASHEDEDSIDILSTHLSRTAEEDFLIREEANKAVAALQEYISTHKKAERNEQILNIVLYEAGSLEEAAKAAGCSSAVAGYVVRSAQRYVREQLGD